jgi:hypothetical protein
VVTVDAATSVGSDDRTLMRFMRLVDDGLTKSVFRMMRADPNPATAIRARKRKLTAPEGGQSDFPER